MTCIENDAFFTNPASQCPIMNKDKPPTRNEEACSHAIPSASLNALPVQSPEHCEHTEA